MIKLHLFHNWSKWEQYTWTGTVTETGLLVPKEQRGIRYPLEEKRQKRMCKICGYVQERVIER